MTLDASPVPAGIAGGAIIAALTGAACLAGTFAFVAVACRRQRARLAWLFADRPGLPSRVRVRAIDRSPAPPVALAPSRQPAALSEPHSAVPVRAQINAGKRRAPLALTARSE